MSTNTRFNVRTSPELYERITTLMLESKRSIGNETVFLLENYFDQLEVEERYRARIKSVSNQKRTARSTVKMAVPPPQVVEHANRNKEHFLSEQKMLQLLEKVADEIPKRVIHELLHAHKQHLIEILFGYVVTKESGKNG